MDIEYSTNPCNCGGVCTSSCTSCVAHCSGTCENNCALSCNFKCNDQCGDQCSTSCNLEIEQIISNINKEKEKRDLENDNIGLFDNDNYVSNRETESPQNIFEKIRRKLK